jgi:hypothetical protein
MAVISPIYGLNREKGTIFFNQFIKKSKKNEWLDRMIYRAGGSGNSFARIASTDYPPLPVEAY